jgi:hypothetical protein
MLSKDKKMMIYSTAKFLMSSWICRCTKNRKMKHGFLQPAFWQYPCCTHTLLVCRTVSSKCVLSDELKDCCLCIEQGRLFGQVGFVCRHVCLPKVPDLQRMPIDVVKPQFCVVIMTTEFVTGKQEFRQQSQLKQAS